MATSKLTPDASDHVQFRKSVYDDDADDLSLSAVEVTQTNLTAHDPPLTPAWLTYTTTTESTQEGPAGNRTYLHIDFDIDTTGLNDNDTALIRIKASDGPHQVEQTFRFMKGDLQMSDISGCVMWCKPEKEDPRPAEDADYNSPTNFGTGVGFTEKGYLYFKRDLFSGRDGMNCNDGMYYGGSFFSTSEGAQPYSVFVIALPADQRNTSIINQLGGEYDLRVQWDGYGDLEYYKDAPGAAVNKNTASKVNPGDEYGLVEYHKRPDGSVYVCESGVVQITDTDTNAFSPANTLFADTYYSTYLICVVGFEADLTNAQVEAVRKRLYQEYEDLQLENITATQFS